MDRSSSEMDESADSGPIVLPEGTRVERDLAYGSDEAQRLDVYLPRQGGENERSILFMVHGGAWKIGDKGASAVVANKAAYWLPRGYIFVSTNYRLFPAADPIGQAHDVAKAMAFVQGKADSWGADPKRLLLMGHSAGAHLVSLLASAPEIPAAEGTKPWLGTIALDSAAYDLVDIMRRRHYRFYDQVFGDDPAYWRTASPSYRLKAMPKPMLMVCSTKRDDSCPQAESFVAKVKALGGRATVLAMPMRHREINEELGLDGSYTGSVDSFIRTLGLP